MSATEPPTSPMPSSWKEEEEDAARAEKKSRIWWIVGGIAIVAIVIGVFVALQGSQEPDRAWPESLGGRPEGLGGEGETADEVDATAAPGVYIWNSFDGWHLWVVNGEGLEGLSGTIKSNSDVVRADASGPEDGSVSTDGKTVTFDLDGTGPVLGVDFDPGFGKELTFTLETADGEVEATQVFTGSKSAPVDAVPVVLEKPVVD